MAPIIVTARQIAIGTYLVFALLYSIFTPIGEAPDELWHFNYQRLIQDEGRLPEARDDHWQGHQAPLYYLILAAWANGVEWALGCRVDPARLPRPADPARGGNENWLEHAASERVTAWGCPELAFHAMRLPSILMTAATIALAFSLLARALPRAPEMVAIAGSLVALLPSHVAASAAINNDALANLTIVGGTYAAVLAWQRGTARALAGAFGVAAVAVGAKLSGLYLFALVGVVALRHWGRLRRAAWAPLAVAALLALVPAAVLARNLAEWGDPFAVAALERCRELLIQAGANPASPSARRFYLEELPSLVLWNLPVAYGVVNHPSGPIAAHAQWYVPLILAGLAVSALPRGRGAWRSVARGPALILLAGLALFLASFLYPSYRYRWLQARYFASQLPVLGLLAAVALDALARALLSVRAGRLGWRLAATHYAWLVALNALVLARGVIRHLYRYIGAAG